MKEGIKMCIEKLERIFDLDASILTSLQYIGKRITINDGLRGKILSLAGIAYNDEGIMYVSYKNLKCEVSSDKLKMSHISNKTVDALLDRTISLHEDLTNICDDDRYLKKIEVVNNKVVADFGKSTKNAKNELMEDLNQLIMYISHPIHRNIIGLQLSTLLNHIGYNGYGTNRVSLNIGNGISIINGITTFDAFSIEEFINESEELFDIMRRHDDIILNVTDALLNAFDIINRNAFESFMNSERPKIKLNMTMVNDEDFTISVINNGDTIYKTILSNSDTEN